MAAALAIRSSTWRWLPTFSSRLMTTTVDGTDTKPPTADAEHVGAETEQPASSGADATQSAEEMERVQGELLAKIKREHQEQCLYHDEEIKFHEEAISRHTESIERHRLLKSQHEATLRQHESEEKQAIYNERNGKKSKE